MIGAISAIPVESVSDADIMPANDMLRTLLEDASFLAPVLVLIAGGSFLVLMEAAMKGGRRHYMPWLTAVIAFSAALITLRPLPESKILFNGSVIMDPFAVFISILILASLGLSALAASAYLRSYGIERGEFYGLMCFGAAGMIMIAVSADLLTLFVSMAVMSISTYALIAFRRDSIIAVEAAFKYFMLSGVSGALLLYGAALLYTATGELGFAGIAEADVSTPLFHAGIGLVTAAFAFKLAAVPFHMWAPDVYEGAPTPVVAFIGAGVKAAVFAGLVRLLVMGLGKEPAFAGPGWGHLVFALCFLSMGAGTLMALVQGNLKRMLGCSWIAHSGYVFLGITAAAWGTSLFIDSVALYLFAYAFASTGAFAVICILEDRDNGFRFSGNIKDLAGLSRKRPALAFAMAVFMLSLAGIPPLLGFIAKFEVLRVVFFAAGETPYMALPLYLLALAGVLTTVAGLYYYLRVIVYMYVMPEEKALDEDDAEEKISSGKDIAAGTGPMRQPGYAAVAVAVLVSVLLGLYPGPLSDRTKSVVQSSFAGIEKVSE